MMSPSQFNRGGRRSMLREFADPLVSIIIPTQGVSQTLTKCLASISSQTYTNIEIIVISKSPRENGDTRSNQLNRGITAAKGKYIYRLDSDMTVRPDAVAKAVSMCESGYDFVAINHRSFNDKTTLDKVRAIEWSLHYNDWLHVAGDFYRKELVLNVGMYDEKLYAGEDYDLHNRMLKAGYKFGIVDSYSVHLGEPDSLRQVVSKNIYYGRNIQVYISKNGVVRVQPLRLVYLRSAPKFRQYFVPFLVYKYIQYASALTGLVTR
jgi:glycosyltransferase involved in cell wall biosynthesis